MQVDKKNSLPKNKRKQDWFAEVLQHFFTNPRGLYITIAFDLSKDQLNLFGVKTFFHAKDVW